MRNAIQADGSTTRCPTRPSCRGHWEDGKSGGDPKKETIGWRLENDTKGSGIWDRGDCETGVVFFQLIFLQELRERG